MSDQPCTFTFNGNGHALPWAADLIAENEAEIARLKAMRDGTAAECDRLHDALIYSGLLSLFVIVAAVAGMFGAPPWLAWTVALTCSVAGLWAALGATWKGGTR